MDATTFSQNFSVKIVNYKYYIDGQKDMATGNILSDAAAVAWEVKCLTNDYSKIFMTAVNVYDRSLSPEQICQDGWKIRKDEIFKWASSVVDISPIIGQTFVPE